MTHLFALAQDQIVAADIPYDNLRFELQPKAVHNHFPRTSRGTVFRLIGCDNPPQAHSGACHDRE